MKKFMILFCLAFILWGCIKEKTPLETVENNYTVDEAIADNCVVVCRGEILNGKSDWYRFLRKELTSVRLVCFTNYILNEPVVDFVWDIKYQNNQYTITYYYENQISEEQYKYLLTDTYNQQTVFYLDNDNESYEEAMRKGLISSRPSPFTTRTLFTVR